jgi:hypothetical protein
VGVGVRILDVGTIVSTCGQPHSSRALGPGRELSVSPPDGQEAVWSPQPLSTSLPDSPLFTLCLVYAVALYWHVAVRV